MFLAFIVHQLTQHVQILQLQACVPSLRTVRPCGVDWIYFIATVQLLCNSCSFWTSEHLSFSLLEEKGWDVNWKKQVEPLVCLCNDMRHHVNRYRNLPAQREQRRSYPRVPFFDVKLSLLAFEYVATSPIIPNTAISLSLLQFLHTLWQQSPMGIDAFSRALRRFHRARGGVIYARNSMKVGCYPMWFLCDSEVV